MKKVFLIVIAVALGLISCMLGVAIFEQERPEPTTPVASPSPILPTTTAPEPENPNPTTTQPSPPDGGGRKDQSDSEETREPVRKVVKSEAPKSRAPEPKSTTKTPDPEPTEEPEPGPTEVYYANCQAAKDAGAAPIRRGEPGYAKKLDRDGDGIACDK